MKVLVHLWCPYIVLIIQLNTIVQLYVISIIYKQAVTIKFSGHLDSGSETVTSTSFETPYDSWAQQLDENRDLWSRPVVSRFRVAARMHGTAVLLVTIYSPVVSSNKTIEITPRRTAH